MRDSDLFDALAGMAALVVLIACVAVGLPMVFA